MTLKKIKVVVAGTKMDDLTIRTIDNTLEAMQELVGGYIEVWFNIQLHQRKIGVLVNEEGIIKQLPVNQNLYPFFIVGQAVFYSYGEDEDFDSLTDEQLAYLSGWLGNVEEFKKRCY